MAYTNTSKFSKVIRILHVVCLISGMVVQQEAQLELSIVLLDYPMQSPVYLVMSIQLL